MNKMNYGQKLLEPFIQFGLIFYSFFLFYFTWSLILSPIAYFVEVLFLEKWKNFQPKEGTTYHEQPKWRVSEDMFGKLELKYDDGERYRTSSDEKAIIVLIIFAPIFRVISLLLSILALFIPPLCIKVENDRQGLPNIFLDIC